MYARAKPSLRMVRQEFAMSCGAACARQLLLDAGIDVAESVVRAHAHFDPNYPICADDLAKALHTLHPGVAYKDLSLDPAYVDAVLARGAFIALLKVTHGKHWVIVDRIMDGFVHIRDPAGTPQDDSVGSDAVMLLDKFHERWRLAINYIVYRQA